MTYLLKPGLHVLQLIHQQLNMMSHVLLGAVERARAVQELKRLFDHGQLLLRDLELLDVEDLSRNGQVDHLRLVHGLQEGAECCARLPHPYARAVA